MTDRLSPDFWKFWAGQTISNLGSSFTGFALPLLVYKLTHSPLYLAGATAAYFVPYLLFGLLIGAWVDRVDRKRLMILVDLGRAAALVSIPISDYLGLLSIWWIFAMAFLVACCTIAFDSGEFAAVPSLVPKDALVAANGRIMASYQGAQVAGPLLAGLLVAIVRLSDILIVDAASFVVSAASLALVRRSFNAEEAPAERKHILRDVQEGLRYVLGHPVLRNISLMMAMINFVGSTTFAQLVLLGKVRLQATDTRIGFLFAAGSMGVVVLGLSAGWIRKRVKFSAAALGSMMVYGTFVAVLGLDRNYFLALVFWAAASGFGLFLNINTQSLRQAIVPSHMLGRVASIAGVLAWSAIPLGTLAGGAVIKALGQARVGYVYTGIGVIIFCLALFFRFFTALGHAEDYLPDAEEPVPLEDRGFAPRAPDLA
jgi:MFS family permease